MSTNTNLKSIEQGRASFAYQRAKTVAENFGKDVAHAYKSYAISLPMLIKTNGLGAALAFVFAKKNANREKKEYAYHLLYQNLTDYVKDFSGHLIKLEGGQDLVQAVISLNSSEYRALTVEVLAFLNWLRRFADGLIEDESTTGGDSYA